jgi:hypothetical protein
MTREEKKALLNAVRIRKRDLVNKIAYADLDEDEKLELENEHECLYATQQRLEQDMKHAGVKE